MNCLETKERQNGISEKRIEKNNSRRSQKVIQEDTEIECWMMTEKNKAVCYINAFEEKEFVS